MISKPFYLENLSAFDILILDDREKAREVIFRVYSILQRDKIWLSEVATAEEIFEEDADLLAEVEAELQDLDQQYDFKFQDFYDLVQQRLKNRPDHSNFNQETYNESQPEAEPSSGLAQEDDDFIIPDDDDLFYDDEDEDDDEAEEYDDFDGLDHLSEDELDLVTDYLLRSAKTRFNYSDLLQDFPGADNHFVDEEFILPVLAGKANGEDEHEIADSLLGSLLEFGYQIDPPDLVKMIADLAKDLGKEILAFQVAVDSLQEGAAPEQVIDQLSHILQI